LPYKVNYDANKAPQGNIAMKEPIDLKKLEQRAWTLYYQDGLWDIYLGLLLFILALMSTALEGLLGGRLDYVIYLVLIGGAWGLFQLGRRRITIPRLGMAKFSAQRHKKRKRLALVMGAMVLFNVLLIFLTVAANRYPETWGHLIPGELAMSIVIGVFAGSAVAFFAYFNDFKRGYYNAVVYGLTFCLVEVLNNPLIFWAGGAFVLIPGLVLFLRFLRQHSMPQEEDR
jgi:hypothetical protein